MSDQVDFMEQPVAALSLTVPQITDDQIDHIEFMGDGRYRVSLLVNENDVQDFVIRAFTDNFGRDHVSISAIDNDELELFQFLMMTIIVGGSEDRLAALVRYFTATPVSKPI